MFCQCFPRIYSVYWCFAKGNFWCFAKGFLVFVFLWFSGVSFLAVLFLVRGNCDVHGDVVYT